MSDNATDSLIYVHDPMCSWCWGFRPVFDKLCRQLPQGVAVRRLLGGLAPDCDAPMSDDMQRYLQATWQRIQQRIPGTRFNFDFWRNCRPRRSTWPACRAVIAARELDADKEVAMIDAIQRAYYLEVMNPSDENTLISLAVRLDLDRQRFAERLVDAATDAQLQREIGEAHGMGADSFPSLRLTIGTTHWPVPVDYLHVEPMLETIEALRCA